MYIIVLDGMITIDSGINIISLSYYYKVSINDVIKEILEILYRLSLYNKKEEEKVLFDEKYI